MQVVPADQYLTTAQRKAVLQKNDWLAIRDITFHYVWIAVAFTLAFFFPNPLVIIVSLFILGGKQLACAILMHDASHYAVFKNKRVNDFIGQWLGAYPIFNNMKSYRPYHHQHHVMNGLKEDPDLLLTRGYPTSRKSMLRKFLRDLTGQTGIKAVSGLILMHLGYLEFNLGGQVVKVPKDNRPGFWLMFRKNLLGPIVANLLILGILWVAASPWLYLLWIGAYFTTFQFSLRVRSIAEHSVVEDREDPYQNTRTTRANWLERLLFAPYHVNYHAEHHLLMSVPSYRFPSLHKMLVAKGYFNKGVLAKGYWEVLKKAGI